MIKLAGGCLLALAGWFGGVAFCEQVTTHRATLVETLALLKTLEEEISCRRANLNHLYQRIASENRFPRLGFCRDTQDGQVNEDAQAMFSSLRPPSCFTGEESDLFLACFTRLGHAGAVQECEQLARYRKRFEVFYQCAVKAEREALAIDRKIGLALGSMLAIVLL